MQYVTNFYFGEVQEEFLGQHVTQAGYIFQHLEQKVCLLSVVSSRKIQGGWFRKCLFKQSTEVRFVLEILENSKVMASKLLMFLLITFIDSTPFLICSRNSTCHNFHPQSVPCLQTYSLGFFLKQYDLEGCFGIDEQWMRTVCGSKTFNKLQTFETSQHFSHYLREKDNFSRSFKGN